MLLVIWDSRKTLKTSFTRHSFRLLSKTILDDSFQHKWSMWAFHFNPSSSIRPRSLMPRINRDEEIMCLIINHFEFLTMKPVTRDDISSAKILKSFYLKISEVSSAYRKQSSGIRKLYKSFMYILKNNRHTTEPWGTPCWILISSEIM